jgi:hypothetical protein
MVLTSYELQQSRVKRAGAEKNYKNAVLYYNQLTEPEKNQFAYRKNNNLYRASTVGVSTQKSRVSQYLQFETKFKRIDDECDAALRKAYKTANAKTNKAVLNQDKLRHELSYNEKVTKLYEGNTGLLLRLCKEINRAWS